MRKPEVFWWDNSPKPISMAMHQRLVEFRNPEIFYTGPIIIKELNENSINILWRFKVSSYRVRIPARANILRHPPNDLGWLVILYSTTTTLTTTNEVATLVPFWVSTTNNLGDEKSSLSVASKLCCTSAAMLSLTIYKICVRGFSSDRVLL